MTIQVYQDVFNSYSIKGYIFHRNKSANKATLEENLLVFVAQMESCKYIFLVFQE